MMKLSNSWSNCWGAQVKTVSFWLEHGTGLETHLMSDPGNAELSEKLEEHSKTLRIPQMERV